MRLLARIGAFLVVVLPVAVVASMVAYLAGSAVLDARGAPVAAWGDPGVARSVIGTGIYLTGVGVLGLGLGVLTRSIGQGVGWLVGLVLVVPGFEAILLPDDWQDALKYLPSNAGAAFTSITDSASHLAAPAGVLVFAGWVLAPGDGCGGRLATARCLTLRSRSVVFGS